MFLQEIFDFFYYFIYCYRVVYDLVGSLNIVRKFIPYFREFFMQKRTVSYVFSTLSLALLVSCGTGKKEEVKVPTEQAPVEQAAPANKEVALADQQPVAADASADEANKAAEENKVA